MRVLFRKHIVPSSVARWRAVLVIALLVTTLISELTASASAAETSITLECSQCAVTTTAAVIVEVENVLRKFSIESKDIYSLRLQISTSEEENGNFYLPVKIGSKTLTRMKLSLQRLSKHTIFPMLYHELGHLIAKVYFDRFQRHPPDGISASSMRLQTVLGDHRLELDQAYAERRSLSASGESNGAWLKQLNQKIDRLEKRSVAPQYGELSEDQLMFIKDAYEEIFADYAAAVYSNNLELTSNATKDPDRGFSRKVTTAESCFLGDVPRNASEELPISCETHSAFAYIRAVIGKALPIPTKENLERLYIALFKSLNSDYADGASGKFARMAERNERLRRFLQ